MNLSIDVSFITSIILLIVIAVIIAFIFTKDIINLIPIMSCFGALSCILYLLLQAPDVGITEAAIGSCLSASLPLLYCFSKDFYHAKEENVSKIFLYIILIIIASYFITSILPEFGNITNSSTYQVSNYYLSNTEHDIGIRSIGTAILADYRAFDTLGETLVILIAAIGVNSLMKENFTINEKPLHTRNLYKIIKYSIMFLALYLLICSKNSPGGGFQFGAIFTIAILLQNLFKPNNFYKNYFKIAIFGSLLYIIIGCISFICDYNFLTYTIFANDAKLAQRIGIILVEIAISISVAASLSLIVSNFLRVR